jgi:hypothetical protein
MFSRTERRDFRQFLMGVGFSHNTLRVHLANLERQGFIMKDKKLIKCGEGSFCLLLTPEIRHKVALAITEPQTTIFGLTF